MKLAYWLAARALKRMNTTEHYCATRGLTGEARLSDCLKPENTADIMKRIEERLETFRKSDFAWCGQMLKNAGNIGSEISTKHNSFMFSVIESCKMIKRNVEGYLKALFRRLRTAMEDEDLTWCLPCYMSF